MKYKVGDKVRIKSLDWYNENKDEDGDVPCVCDILFLERMKKYCGKILTISKVYNCTGRYDGKHIYEMEGAKNIDWTEDMIECKVEENKDMKYKVGDKVRIKSIDWYNENKDENGNIRFRISQAVYPIFFSKIMSEFCGKIVTVKKINDGSYYMKETSNCEFWTDEMIEGLVEDEETYDFLKTDIPYPSKPRVEDFLDMFNDTITLPEGFVFRDQDGNVINATKIVLEKKKPKYPQTYEECLEIMGVKISDCYIQGYKAPLFEDLQQLLICRNAYWKIAGEEMGLGKPWEPINGKGEKVYSIVRACGTIKKNSICDFSNCYILEFPTKEMRDAFYENFEEEMENCKELL